MRSVTFTADEELIERARSVARAQHKSLNLVFRDWLRDFVAAESLGSDYDSLMKRLAYAESSGPYTRDEMNER